MLGMLRVQAKHDLLLRRVLSCDLGNNYISKEVAISQIGRQIHSQKTANESWWVANCRGEDEFTGGQEQI